MAAKRPSGPLRVREATTHLEGLVSLHLSWAELACRDKTPYPAEWRDTRALILAEEFEAIREMAGNLPIQVLSGYRTPERNRQVGGARSSQHMAGKALDIKHTVLTPLELLDVVLERARSGSSKIRGVGYYHWGVHFDIRPGERLARWSGNRVFADGVPV